MGLLPPIRIALPSGGLGARGFLFAFLGGLWFRELLWEFRQVELFMSLSVSRHEGEHRYENSKAKRQNDTHCYSVSIGWSKG